MKKILSSIFLIATSINWVNAQWSTSGNSLISTNFFGSTNSMPLRFRVNTNGLTVNESMRILSNPTQSWLNMDAPPVIINPKTLTSFSQHSFKGLAINDADLTFLSNDGNFGQPYDWRNSIKWVNQQGNIRHLIVDDNSGLRILAAGILQIDNGVAIGAANGNNAVQMTHPNGYKLYVKEGILTEKVKIALLYTSDWADYVFAPDYKLKSLTEVEKYIQKNKHLPGVPSAEEMVSNGLDVVKTDAILMAKIEELTLYMIELQKQNAAMQVQINELKIK
jgi:hypothetical protein